MLSSSLTDHSGEILIIGKLYTENLRVDALQMKTTKGVNHIIFINFQKNGLGTLRERA
jgi:hypothetical protein